MPLNAQRCIALVKVRAHQQTITAKRSAPLISQIGKFGIFSQHPHTDSAMELSLNLLDLEKTPASDVKAKGWPELMRKVARLGAVVVTNHNHPQAVVVSAEEYQRLVAQASGASAAAQRAQSLKQLQAEFDAHLAVLDDGKTLAKALDRPARRGLKITPGKSL